MRRDVDGALPVRLGVDPRLADELAPFLEGTLGWQVTRSEELPAALAVVGVADAPRGSMGRQDGAHDTADVPTVLLVRDDDPPGPAARAGARSGAVLHWPSERDQLVDVAARLLGATEHLAAGPTTVRLGGAAGGVGVTTVALALGGLLAWHGRRALVVASGDVPVADTPSVDPAALAAHRTWEAAAPVPGVEGLRVLATGPGPRAPATVPDGTLVVRDDGVGVDVDVLVCLRDRAGLQGVDTTTAGLVVVGDRGPVRPAAWQRATAGRAPQVVLAVSERVARAGLVSRVPSSLPGRWLAPLQPLARSLLG